MWCKIVLPFPFSFSVSLSSISMSLSSRAHFSSALFVIFVWPGLLHSFSLTESFNFNFIYVKVAHGIWSFPEIFVFASRYVSTFRTCVQVYLEWLPCLCWFLPSFHTLWLISCPFEVIIFLRYLYKAAFYTLKCCKLRDDSYCYAHVLKFDALPVCHTACPEEAEYLKTFFFVETILRHGSLFQGSDEV